MQIEWKKVSLSKYIIGVCISLVGMMFLTILPLFISEMGEEMYKSPIDILETIALFVRLLFTIFIGVLLAAIVTKEYESGTIQNVFLYPISKKKIMISKLLLIIILSFFLMFTSQFLISGFISYFNNRNQLVAGKIDGTLFKSFLISSVFLMIATIATSMISLFVGLRKKSSVATIVTAVIVGLLVNGQMGTGSNRIASNAILMVILSMIGCVIVFLSIRNVEKEDI